MNAAEQREYCGTTITDALKASGGKVYTLTTFGRGESDHVRIFAPTKGHIVEITWHVAQLMGRKVKPRAGIRYGGGGYSKGLDAAMDAYQVIGRDLDQGDWQEL